MNLSEVDEERFFVLHPKTVQLLSIRIFATGQLKRNLDTVSPDVVVVLHSSYRQHVKAP